MIVEHDLVYLKQPITMGPYRPTVWDVIKTARTERENSETLRPEIASQGQTESIQHILLPYRSAKHRRLCLGCHYKLNVHWEQLRYVAYWRAWSRPRRPKRTCKMCHKVQQQIYLEGISADEAAIRKQLLRERMLAMVPDVQNLCTSLNYNLHEILYPVSSVTAAEETDLTFGHDEDGSDEGNHSLWRSPSTYPGHTDSDYLPTINDDVEASETEDDAVSICSNDAGDDFAWYNNTRRALIVETIPFPTDWGSGEEIPPEYIEVPLTPATPGPSATRPEPSLTSELPATTPAPARLPSLHPSNYRSFLSIQSLFHDSEDVPDDWSYYWPEGEHGSHPDCNRVQIHNRFANELPIFFPSLKSLFLFDRNVKLREGITDLPSEGRRWYSGNGRGVYIEVVNPEDDRWVFPSGSQMVDEWYAPDEHRYIPDDDSNADDESDEDEDESDHGVRDYHMHGPRDDPVGVVEFVRYLRGFYAKGLVKDGYRWRVGERREIRGRHCGVSRVGCGGEGEGRLKQEGCSTAGGVRVGEGWCLNRWLRRVPSPG
jgi:hypothetical protein